MTLIGIGLKSLLTRIFCWSCADKPACYSAYLLLPIPSLYGNHDIVWSFSCFCRFSASLLWTRSLHHSSDEGEVPHESHRGAARSTRQWNDWFKRAVTHYQTLRSFPVLHQWDFIVTLLMCLCSLLSGFLIIMLLVWCTSHVILLFLLLTKMLFILIICLCHLQ